MKKIKIQNIILYIINFILIGFIILSNNGVLLNSNKLILKNMSESTQINDLNKSIETLNNSHTEYANYIQECKTNIATSLTNEGVSTSNDDTLETMATNISKILQVRTSDATATADNISEGKTAYVNGQLITGNGTDNINYANNGEVIASHTYVAWTQDSANGAWPQEERNRTIEIPRDGKLSFLVDSMSVGLSVTINDSAEGFESWDFSNNRLCYTPSPIEVNQGDIIKVNTDPNGLSRTTYMFFLE